MEKEKKKVELTPFEKMAQDITKVRDALESLREAGISMELMEIYIANKAKLSRRMVKSILDSQREFLNGAVKR